MWKRNKNKNEFIRKVTLFGGVLFLMIVVIVFWNQVFSTKENQIVLPVNLTSQDKKSGSQNLDEKIKSAFAVYSCEPKQEKIIKGFVSRVEEDYILVSDGTEQVKIYLKPETIFARVTVYPNGESELTEINKSDLSINQDIVASVFLNSENVFYSLLIKQINLVK